MLKMLFLGMLEASTTYYGDSIGLAPIALSTSKVKFGPKEDFWEGECSLHPNSVACLNYDA